MTSVEIKLNGANKSNVHSIADQVCNQLDDIDSHQKKCFNLYPLHPYATSCASADISISGTECDIRSYGYDSDNLLNSGYAASVSDATRSIGSVGGFDDYEASTCYMSSVEQLSITQADRDEKSIDTDAHNAHDSPMREYRGKRRNNRSHSRRDARKVTISSEFRNFLGWVSTEDEMNDIAQFQSNDVEVQIRRPRIVSIDESICKDPVKGVLTQWSKYSIPCIAVQDSEEDVSTINDSRFETDIFPIADVRIRSDEDSQANSSTYNKRSGGKLGWLYILIMIMSFLTLLTLIIVVVTQRM